MDRLRAIFDSGTFLQILWAFLVSCFAQLGTVAAILAIVVIVYKIKENRFRAKLAEAQYEKFCTEIKERRLD